MSFRSKIKDFMIPYRVKRELAAQAEANHKAVMERLDKLDQKTEYLFWLSQQLPGESMAETKKRVFLSMPKAEGETWIKQRANLWLLRKLKSLCDSHGIQFSLAFGTLLGAVRHQGFVPWDDDIDICILREDFQKLRAVLEHDEVLQLDVCYDLRLGYQFAKLKFRESKTFFVDVFIMDQFDADAQTLPARYEELKLANVRYIAASKDAMLRHGADQWQTLMPQCSPEVQTEMETVFRQMCESLPYYGSGSYLCFGFDCPTFIRNQGYVYPCSQMLPYEKNALRFEGDDYDSLRDPDLWLHNAYGDYWSLPKTIRPGHPELSSMDENDLRFLRRIGALESADLSCGRMLDSLKITF